MKYIGSKNKHAKEILQFVLKNRKFNQYYVEPFIGGANIIDKVQNPRIGNDNNHYLIALLQKLQEDWLPPKEITEEDYYEIKENQLYCSDALLGYVGFQLSYGAKWFSGYRKDSEGFRNYSLEAFNNVANQAPLLKGIQLFCSDYRELEIPDNSIIYCDPPYENTINYQNESFDHKIFWDWCRTKIKEGHSVFISEYSAPDDFVNLWGKTVCSSLSKNTGSKREIEKLFIHETQIDNYYLEGFLNENL